MVAGSIGVMPFCHLVVIQVCSLCLDHVAARVDLASINEKPDYGRFLELFPRTGVNSFIQHIPSGRSAWTPRGHSFLQDMPTQRSAKTPRVHSFIQDIPSGRSTWPPRLNSFLQDVPPLPTATTQRLKLASLAAVPPRRILRLHGNVPLPSRPWRDNQHFSDSRYRQRQPSRPPTTADSRNAGQFSWRPVKNRSVFRAPQGVNTNSDNHKTAPWQDRTKTAPRQDRTKTAPRQDRTKTAPRQDSTKTAPSPVWDVFNAPSDGPSQNFTSPIRVLSFDQTGGIREIWSYGDSDTKSVGPNQWYRHFPSCGHGLQSPIDISGNNFQYSPLAPITLRSSDGSGVTEITISNNGFTATITPSLSTMYIDCDDLPGTYILSGIHFHWGSTDFAGSEHQLHGKTYPLEMHLVSYNSIYGSLVEAEGKQDGVHVLAIFFEMLDRDNLGLNFCIEKLMNVRNPGAEVRGELVNISGLLPPAHSPYYRYVGSLTTPPCTEQIIWSVYSTPQDISSQQLAQFRYLAMSTDPDPYTGGNVRPLQPLENRIILTNDPAFMGWK